MASRRDFKKDINFLTNEILMRGIIHIEFFGNKNSEDVYAIMNEAASLRNNYIARVNEKTSAKTSLEVKAHFKVVYDELLKSTHELLDRIDNLDLGK